VQVAAHGRLGLFRRATHFRLLFFATLGSGAGTYLAAVALTVDIFDRTGSGSWVSALLIADFLPIIVIGIALGPLVDRLSRRRVMIGSDLVRFAVFCALPFADRPATIVALAGVAGIATGFFRPAVYAGLPNLVDDADLPGANSLLQSVENLAWMIGPLVAGLLLAVSGPHLPYWINAVTFLVSASLVFRIPGSKLQTAVAKGGRGHWSDVRDGLSLVRRSRPLLTVLVVWNVVLVGNSAVNVAEVSLAKVSLAGGDFGFGLLVGATGLGLTLGSLAAGRAVERRGVRLTYSAGIALMAFGFGAAAVAPNVWVAALCAASGAAGNGAALVCNALLVQRGAPDELRGRAFTVIMSSNYILLGLGMVAAGPLTNAVGGRWMWGGAAAFYLAAAAVAASLARGLVATAPAPRAAPEGAAASN
jgi:MFS family permease